MNTDLINLYIDSLLKEVSEGAKSKILLETQLRYTEMMNGQLQTKVKELESQLEKLNKKKPKEVNTSENF